MLTSDFSYDLPDELIAQYPLVQRVASRLLVLGRDGGIVDESIPYLKTLLQPGDLLVVNNTRVLAARLYGRKPTGGKVEILVERLLGENEALAQVKASKSPKPGTQIILDSGIHVEVLGREDDLFRLGLTSAKWMDVLNSDGHMPLPPYIDRSDESLDENRYQTVFAEVPGAVAAPTAGLHFDQALLDDLQAYGVETAEVTLHVGAGTYQPVRVEKIEDHVLHAERVTVSAETCGQIADCKRRGGRVVAVGTTSVRSLEAAAFAGKLAEFEEDTRLYITPGFQFKVVDALLTNFHLPESSLMMLVTAFGGYDAVMQAYRHAVESKYRFFSYGDAMFIEKATQS
ncbi:MAG TPA: tRNA preQ1(34) S-adenosylmethionine ribosyltransferase-isomerase QueA [Gammaproteobacteria bacterium]|nr:tRNA preQ1(34) S-adenosylmethionine ribosyltransferase-isomerase QueA [Gammaproteobacteria bacterium]